MDGGDNVILSSGAGKQAVGCAGGKQEPREIVFKAIKWQLEETDEELFIHITGMTKEQESVHVRVEGFHPFVFLELPPSIEWTTKEIKTLVRHLKRILPSAPSDYSYEVKNLCRFNIPAQFLKLSFPENESIKKLGYYIYKKEGVSIKGIGSFSYGDFRLHEQNIDTIVKYATVKKLKMAGWIKVTERLVPPEDKLSIEERKFTTCDIDMPVYYKNVSPVENVDVSIQINPKIFSFDIESYSKNKNSKSPDATVKENCTFQIAVTCGRLLDDIGTFKSYLLSLNNCADIDGADVRNFEDEEKLLIGFVDLMNELDPDLIIGYNILKYDWDAILTRAAKCGCYIKMLKCGRIYGKRSTKESIKWASKAYKEQEFNYLNPDGRINIDIYPEVERNYKLDSYSLDAVSEHFLKEHKEDMPYKQMFTLFEISSVCEKMIKASNKAKGLDVHVSVIDDDELLEKMKEAVKNCMEVEDFYPDEDIGRNYVYEAWEEIKNCDGDSMMKIVRNCMKKIGTYCIQDTVLPIKLFHTLHLWDGLEQLANVTCIPMWYLQTRGQQVKVLAQYYRRTLFSNVVIEYNHIKEDDGTKYQGATVIEAHPGCYDLIATLDFASLYPSIMIAYNICHTTELMKDDPTPDDQCNVIEWEDHRGCFCPKDVNRKKTKQEDVLCGRHKYRFKKAIRHPDGTIENEGLIPRMLRELLGERAKVKGTMKGIGGKIKDLKIKRGDFPDKKKGNEPFTEDDAKNLKKLETEYIVLDALQLGLKVSANSTYGFLGAKKGYCPLPSGAASVTAKGREMIMFTARKILEKFDCAKVVYGDTDSVMVNFRGKNTKEVFKMAKEAAAYVTSFFPEPVELSFECVYDPYVLLTKKRYMANIIDEEGNILKQVKKGVVLARRDNCHYLRHVYSELNKLIMNRAKESVVMNSMVDMMNDLFHMNIHPSKFILYKGIQDPDSYDENISAAHVILARRMNDRGDTVAANTRLRYVFLLLPNEEKGVLQGDKAEDWTFFLENRRKNALKIDYLYYFEKQFVNPLTELIDVMYPKKDVLYEKPEDAVKRQIMIMDQSLIPENFSFSRLNHIRKLDDKIYLIKTQLDRKDFPELFDACDRYKSSLVLDKVYKKFGCKKRLAKRPKKGEVTVRQDCKLMTEFFRNHVAYHEVVKQLNDKFSTLRFESDE